VTGARRFCPLVVFALSILFSAPNAQASPVTFSTAGTFTCAGCAGSGSNAVTFLGGQNNALLLMFTGLGSTSLSTPTGSSFGNFQTFFSGTGAIAASGTFTLTITQSVPFAGSDSFASTFTGLFSASNSGSGVVVPPASNNGITTVQGQITTTATPTPVPEPGSLLLLGAGLAGVGAYRRLRRSRG
jgi:hypothetical protein